MLFTQRFDTIRHIGITWMCIGLNQCQKILIQTLYKKIQYLTFV